MKKKQTPPKKKTLPPPPKRKPPPPPKKKISASNLYKREKSKVLWEQIKILSTSKRPNYKKLLALMGRYRTGSNEPTELDDVPLAKVHIILKNLLKLDKLLENKLKKNKILLSKNNARVQIERAIKELKQKGTSATWPIFFLKKILKKLDQEYNTKTLPARSPRKISTKMHNIKQKQKKLKKKKSTTKKNKLDRLKVQMHMLSLELKQSQTERALRKRKLATLRASVLPMTREEVFERLGKKNYHLLKDHLYHLLKDHLYHLLKDHLHHQYLIL